MGKTKSTQRKSSSSSSSSSRKTSKHHDKNGNHSEKRKNDRTITYISDFDDEFDFDFGAARKNRHSDDFVEEYDDGFESDDPSSKSRMRNEDFSPHSSSLSFTESFKIFDFFKTINPLSLFISLIVGTSFISFAEAVRVNLVAPIVDVIIPEDFLDNKLKFKIKDARTVKLFDSTSNKTESVTLPPKIIDLGEIINVLLKLILTTLICYMILKVVYSVSNLDSVNRFM